MQNRNLEYLDVTNDTPPAFSTKTYVFLKKPMISHIFIEILNLLRFNKNLLGSHSFNALFKFCLGYSKSLLNADMLFPHSHI